ncbi:glycosyltransferase family 2 protein [Pseudomonas solani]|uniref:glycosyltransferase family 2 protein n=1 Tax=Pseudomonas solani TaxID=2731552 RepID=UPI003F4A884A
MSTLSVILPIYNAAPYLDETVNSLLQQSRSPDQIIAINDGSNDRSLEVLERHGRSDSRIQIISKENGGVSSARNLGLEACEGDYVALMDADDICHPDRFQAQIRVMENEKIDLCGSWMTTFGRNKRKVKYPTGNSELRDNYLFLGRTISNPSAMIRKSIIGNSRYDESLVFAEDYDFFLSLLLSNPQARLCNIPKALLKYRTHDLQASQIHINKNESSLKAIFLKQFNRNAIPATQEQIDVHYEIWRNKKTISLQAFNDYLPLMQKLVDFLELAPHSKKHATLRWISLLKQQPHLKPESEVLVRESSNYSPSLWTRLITHCL